MNDITFGHRKWKKFIDWMNPQPITRCRIASGTGDITKIYLEKLKENGQVRVLSLTLKC